MRFDDAGAFPLHPETPAEGRSMGAMSIPRRYMRA
jgi:hypothetical protein